jgi:hypothetical protein
VVILGRMTLQKGNWRYACENAFDEGHFKYLHRYGAVHSLTWKLPAWSKIKVVLEDQGWLSRDVRELGFSSEYGELGRWPPKRFWNWRRVVARISMRLPCIMRNNYVGTNIIKFAWYAPVGRDRNRYLQLYVIKARSLPAKVWTHIYFWAYARWAELVQFNNQDAWMVALMPETPPERLYRPDVSITAWRKFCEHARGEEPPALPFGEELAGLEEQPAEQEAQRGGAASAASPAGGQR